MPLLVGIALALGVGVFGTTVGFDRDRSFYPTIMIVIAFYYVLFAVMGGTSGTVLAELAVATVFVAMSVAGFRGSLWLVALALAAHGLMDLVHHRFITNPGVPTWWPWWCMGYDVAAAGYLGWLLKGGRLPARS